MPRRPTLNSRDVRRAVVDGPLRTDAQHAERFGVSKDTFRRARVRAGVPTWRDAVRHLREWMRSQVYGDGDKESNDGDDTDGAPGRNPLAP